MITHKDWKEFKKKHEVPDGVNPKIKMGDVLDRYHKSKQTDADLKKMETDINAYVYIAKKAKFASVSKVVAYLLNALNTEIAERQEAEANTPVEKTALGDNTAKRYREFVTTLTKHHANLSALAKLVKANPAWFATGASADPTTKQKHDKLCEGIDAELKKLFAYCRDGGGPIVDIPIGFTTRLSGISTMTHDNLDYQLTECLEQVKETADKLADQL